MFAMHAIDLHERHTPRLRFRGLRRIALIGAIVPLVAAALPACTTVEGSGRRQVNMFTMDEEQQMGADAYPQLLKDAKVITSGPQYERAMRVANQVTAAAKIRHPATAGQFQWQWTVIDDDSVVNAWALPGGKCAIYTGILKVATTDDELAVVLGHECSHAIARHGGEQATRQRAEEGATQAAAKAGAQFGDPTGGSASGTLISGLVLVGVELPYSRRQESEADSIGIMVSSAAGYDPQAAIGFWTKMSQSGGSKGYQFLSTHPSDDARIANLKTLMPQAQQVYQEAKASGGMSKSQWKPATK